MAAIESYTFGHMVIDGRSFKSDLIIFPDRVDGNWRRQEGHVLSEADIIPMLDAQPEIIIIGCGSPGMLSVPRSTVEAASRRGVEVRALPTEAASALYNRLSKVKRVVAAFHLTC